MSFQEKYRPKSFKEYIGNASVVMSIEASLNHYPRPQVFMLSGPPGVGKTSIARIIASMLNFHVIELNNSNENGVDFAREFENKVAYKSFQGDTLYILDECHRLTTDAQKILLKVLEEPPQHITVVMCTTEPQKMDKAIRSRALHYELKVPTMNEVLSRLQFICQEEGIQTHDEVLKQIYITYDGLPRDCIKELHKLQGVPVERQLELITTSIESQSEVIAIARALTNRQISWNNIAKILESLNADGEAVRRILTSYFSKVILNREDHDAFGVLWSLKSMPQYPSKHDIIFTVFEAYRNIRRNK